VIIAVYLRINKACNIIRDFTCLILEESILIEKATTINLRVL
jgi:hypothetical protein